MGKANGGRNTRRILEKIDRIRKVCNFSTKSAEELLISKYMTAIIDKKSRHKMMKKNTGIEKNDRFKKAKHIRKE